MYPSTIEYDPIGFDNGPRGRFNAWFFGVFDRYTGYIARDHKREAFGAVQPGRIVEIGPGVGANFEYLPSGSDLVAVEPNRAMHQRLTRRAAAHAIDLELIVTSAEQMPIPDESVDDVLCSLVLCSVEDPQAVLAEVKRILRPGGRFRFVEHVAAPIWSPRRWIQQLLRRPWRWVFEGCDLCNDTASAIEVAGFSSVTISRGRWRNSIFVPANTSIHGIAVR